MHYEMLLKFDFHKFGCLLHWPSLPRPDDSHEAYYISCYVCTLEAVSDTQSFSIYHDVTGILSQPNLPILVN